MTLPSTRSRAELIARLHVHPADLTATGELQAMDAEAAARQPTADRSQSDRLVRGGLSSNERTRLRLRSWGRTPS